MRAAGWGLGRGRRGAPAQRLKRALRVLPDYALRLSFPSPHRPAPFRVSQGRDSIARLRVLPGKRAFVELKKKKKQLLELTYERGELKMVNTPSAR